MTHPMRKLGIAVALIILALLWFAVRPHAQGGGAYRLSWFTLNAGGSSNKGDYDLVAAIGQPDAAVWGGGQYTLHGGFLSPAHTVYLPLIQREGR